MLLKDKTKCLLVSTLLNEDMEHGGRRGGGVSGGALESCHHPFGPSAHSQFPVINEKWQHVHFINLTPVKGAGREEGGLVEEGVLQSLRVQVPLAFSRPDSWETQASLWACLAFMCQHLCWSELYCSYRAYRYTKSLSVGQPRCRAAWNTQNPGSLNYAPPPSSPCG